MLFRQLRYLPAVVLLGILSLPARGQDSSPIAIVFFPERQRERRQSRWTLDSWLRTKEKMAAQDRWLMQHTNKLPMDFTFSWDLSPYRQGFEIDYYLMRAGLRLRYEDASSWLPNAEASDINNQMIEVDAQFRLFGGNIQDTNLILRVGYEYNNLKHPTGPRDYYTGFSIGPELQVYLAQWLGLRGEYKKLLKQETRFQDRAFGGSSYFASAFLEVGSLRGEFGYRSKEIEFTEGLSGEYSETGLFGRLRLFY